MCKCSFLIQSNVVFISYTIILIVQTEMASVISVNRTVLQLMNSALCGLFKNVIRIK
jgi:hypothetical protein